MLPLVGKYDFGNPQKARRRSGYGELEYDRVIRTVRRSDHLLCHAQMYDMQVAFRT
jgi:hypothetical protein